MIIINTPKNSFFFQNEMLEIVDGFQNKAGARFKYVLRKWMNLILHAIFIIIIKIIVLL